MPEQEGRRLGHGRKAAERAHEQAEADRARLQDALVVLQQSLLPADLPSVPGMEAAAHYRTASVRLASGGHPPALVLRADGTAGFLPTPGGLLVGILPTASFATATTVLGAGDTRLLYTDGLTEARTGEDRSALYGDEALRALAASHAGESPQAVVEALAALLDGFGDGLDDDTALLALGVPAPAPTHQATS